MSTKYLAYTYLIGWIDQDQWYYGLRYENIRLKRTPEEDFWTYYKTSSKPVKQMRAFIGEPNYISIDKTFESIEEAIEYENQILTEMNVLNNDEWLNKTSHLKSLLNQKENHPLYGVPSKRKKKVKINDIIFDSITEAAIYFKVSRSTIRSWIKNGIPTKETTKKKYEKRKNGMLGKNHTKESKDKMSICKYKKVKVKGLVFLSITEASNYFKVSMSSINRWIEKGYGEYL